MKVTQYRTNCELNVALLTYMKSQSIMQKKKASFTDRVRNNSGKAIKRFLWILFRPFCRLIKKEAFPVLFRCSQYLLRDLYASLYSQHQQLSQLNETMKQVQGNLSQLQTLCRTEKMLVEIKNNSIDQKGISQPCDNAVIGSHVGGTTLLRTSIGYMLCDSSDHLMIKCLASSGDLELGPRKLIESILSPRDIFVDLGAHIGIHTVAAAKIMQDKGRIIAIEPFARTHELLRQNIMLNGHAQLVETIEKAVSNTPSTNRKLYLGKTSCHHSLQPLTDQPQQEQFIRVAVDSLEQMLEGIAHITLLKIDAKGEELAIMEGAKSIIANNPDILIMVAFSPSHLKCCDNSLEKWLATFAQYGFIYYLINKTNGKLQNLTTEQLKKFESVNLLFAKPNSPRLQKLSVEK